MALTHLKTTTTLNDGRIFVRTACGKRSTYARHIYMTEDKAQVDCPKCVESGETHEEAWAKAEKKVAPGERIWATHEEIKL